jgi:hypothetical protein
VQPGTRERERRWKWGFLRTEAAPVVLARASACSEGARGDVGRVRAHGAGGQRRVVSLTGAAQAQGSVDLGEPRCCGSELRGCAGLRYPAERRHWGDGLRGNRAAAAVSELGGAQQPQCRGSLSERSALRLTHDCGDTCRGGLLPRFRGRQAVGATSPKINSSNPRGHVLARNFQN